MQRTRFVKRYSAYDTFLKSVRNEKTRRRYVDSLSTFLKFCDFDKYDQLLEIPDSEKAEAIKEFVIYLDTERHLSSSTINNYFFPIKLFYEVNNVLLNWKQLARNKPGRRRVVDDRLYTDMEIKKFLDFANPRERVVILTLLSTGMRIGGLASITLKDMTLIEDYHLYKFSVYSEDITDRYTTFCTPECREAIDVYLDYRRNYGEQLTPDSFLIVQAIDPETYIPSIQQEKGLNADSIAHIVARLQHKANIFKKTKLTEANTKGRIHKPAMQCHAFRKIFNTRCIEHNINHSVKETLMGHKSKLGLDVHYFRPTDKQLLDEYLKVLDALTVNEENRLKKENKILKTELQITDRQIQGMKDNLLIIAKKVGLDVDELTSKFYE